MEVDFSFASSKIHDARAGTRLKALTAAKKKAQAMAEVVGAKLGKAQTINWHPENRNSSHVLSRRETATYSATPPRNLAWYLSNTVTTSEPVWPSMSLISTANGFAPGPWPPLNLTSINGLAALPNP